MKKNFKYTHPSGAVCLVQYTQERDIVIPLSSIKKAKDTDGDEFLYAPTGEFDIEYLWRVLPKDLKVGISLRDMRPMSIMHICEELKWDFDDLGRRFCVVQCSQPYDDLLISRLSTIFWGALGQKFEFRFEDLGHALKVTRHVAESKNCFSRSFE